MYKELDIYYLRDSLKSLVLNQQQHLVFDNPNDIELKFPPYSVRQVNSLTRSKKFLFEYFKLMLTAEHCALELCPDLVEEGKRPLILDLTDSDFRKCTMTISVVAWLTIDSFRWHKLKGFEEIPEDLYYGLVLEYPRFISAMAAYLLKIDREEQLKLLDGSKRNLFLLWAENSSDSCLLKAQRTDERF